MIQLIKNWFHGGKPKRVYLYWGEVTWADIEVKETFLIEIWKYPDGELFHKCVSTQYYCAKYNKAEEYVVHAYKSYWETRSITDE